MEKQLKKIIEKLGKGNINSLTAEEVRTYFEHRVAILLSNKRILVKDELRYLLSETGPGNLRFDPRYLDFLLQDTIFTYLPFKNIPEIQAIGIAKQKAESYIISNLNSDKTQNILKSILRKCIQKAKIISIHPFIIQGTIRKVPISCIIKNGEWILPSPDTFSFLEECQHQKRFPIIVAKKVSGILFPVFKILSVFGLNIYKTYLPEEARKLIETISATDKNLREIKYNSQFILKADNYQEKEGKDLSSDPILNFFENIVSDNIPIYYNNFLGTKIKIADNFIDTVSQFRKNRSTKGLLENYQMTQSLIQNLRN